MNTLGTASVPRSSGTHRHPTDGLSLRRWLWLGLIPLAWTPLQGQIVIESHPFNTAPLPLMPIDPSAAGVYDTRVITSAITSITDVNVTLQLVNPLAGGAYNGDYFVSLSHDSGFSVLLNRVGVRTGMTPPEQLGYADNGFNVTLDDQATILYDIHAYRLQLGGGDSHNTPVDVNFVAPLTGTWRPDGRNPVSGPPVIETPRTALLDQFNGLAGGGTWSLFVADLNAGGTANLVAWGLEISGTTSPVPEPTSTQVIAGVVLLLVAGGYRLSQRPRG